MVFLKIGSEVIIRKPNLPGKIVGQDKKDKNIWLVRFHDAKGEEKTEFISRWKLRASKPDDPIFKGGSGRVLQSMPTESLSDNSSRSESKSSDDEDDVVEYPLPDFSSSSESSSDENEEALENQNKKFSRKAIDNKSVPFGKGVLVVISKGNLPGIIVEATGSKTWKVKYREHGEEKRGTFKSKQMRRPRNRKEYFVVERRATPKKKNLAAEEDEDEEESGSDSADESEEDSMMDPNDDGKDERHQNYSGDTEDNQTEGQPAFDERKLRFIASLEPKDERYDRKVKEYQAIVKKLIKNQFTVTKKKTFKSMGIGTAIVERKKGGRKGEIVGGTNKGWKVKFDDGTTESGISSQSLKRMNKDSRSEGPRYVWRLVEASDPEQGKEVIEYTNIGLAGFDFDRRFSDEAIKSKKSDYDFPFLKLLQDLWPGDWRQQLERLNSYIENDYNQGRASKRRMSLISENEWWKFIGILIGAAPLGRGGNRNLFDHHERDFHSFVDPINLGTQKNGRGYMSMDRFVKIRGVFPKAFAHPEKQDNDPWWMVLDLLEGFNRSRKKKFASSVTKTDDETMSALVPRTTPFGGLPTLSFVERKPEPLGTEFKTVCCAYTGVMLYVELQRGKEVMPFEKYSEKFGCTAACTLRLAEGSQHCGENVPERKEAAETFKRELVIADAWFGSVKVAEQLKMLHIDDEGKPAGHEIIAAVKSNHALFPKKEIEDLMADFPSGAHLVFECESPVTGIPLVAIGYKYNARKILCFVATKNAGTTRPGKPYVAKFPDEFGNVANRVVPRPSIVSRYFGNSDSVDAHNHARQYQLALEKRWVTHCGWFRINTTFIGITVTDAWKCIKFQSKNPTLKKMTIKQFAERIAWDCTHNPHSSSKDSTAGNSFIPVDSTAAGDVVSNNGATNHGFSLFQEFLNQAQSGCIPISDLGSLSHQTNVSPLSSSRGSSRPSFGRHDPILNEKKTSDGRSARRRCRICHKQTPWMCNHPVCRAQSDGALSGSFYCNTTKKDGGPRCIEMHRTQVEEFANK